MMEQLTSHSTKLFGRNKQQQSETDEIAAAEKLSQQNELEKTTNPQSQASRNQQQEQSDQSQKLALQDLSERAKSYGTRTALFSSRVNIYAYCKGSGDHKWNSLLHLKT
jgi:hypothetical protein